MPSAIFSASSLSFSSEDGHSRGGDGGQASDSGGGGDRAEYLTSDHVCHLIPPRVLSNHLIYRLSVGGFAQISEAAIDGDFTWCILVEASREMDSLKMQMVFNLRNSIQKNTAAREAANRSKGEFLTNMSHKIRFRLVF